MRLKDKVAIVTGSGLGIGKEIALTLAREGCKVVVSDLTSNASKLAGEMKTEGLEVLAVKCDVSKSEDVNNMVKATIEKFGRIDILVNNAGIYPIKPFIDMSEADWDKVINVNLKGSFNCSRAVVSHMIKQKYGKIINMSSIEGFAVGIPQLAHYCASKAGMVGLTRSLALELASYGINVNAIAPGPIETPGTSSIMTSELYEQTKRTIPLGRWGKPTDIANLTLFLASDESSFITGQCIVADGGYTIQ